VQIFSIMASATTVVSFILFLAIVMWAYSKGRKSAFDRAALEPFALPDDSEPTGSGNDNGVRQ